MTPIRTFIVDDEPLARAGLRVLLERAGDIDIIGEYGNGVEAVAAVARLQPELLFIDVRMPRLDGLAAVAQMETPPVTIFVTAYDQHALRAFEVSAFDYVLKPVDADRFAQALERAKAQVLRIRRERSTPAFADRLPIKDAGRTLLLTVDEIDWIEAERDYARVHAGRARHLVRESLNRLASQLDPQRFVRVHRGAIVNLARVVEVRSARRGSYVVVLRDGTCLPLSRHRRAEVNALLGAR